MNEYLKKIQKTIMENVPAWDMEELIRIVATNELKRPRGIKISSISREKQFEVNN